tara:strand:+ start:2080 stop:2784 length:705 start_codon:yes stop_codon:yes gene_type:complete
LYKSFSVVAVADTKISQTIKALKISCEKISINKVFLITSKNINKKLLFKELTIVKVKPIKSFKEYNHFIIYKLYKYITTTHVLLIQWDGFILNKNKWTDKYFDYDYIGAPLIPRENNFEYSKDKKGNFYTVGNGGFSLRSLELLEAASKYKLEDDYEITNYHEDGFYCVLHREFLEKQGFKWAPFKVARNFSIESPLTFEYIFDIPFGFHGKKMLLIYKILLLINKKFRLNLIR